MLYSSVTSPQIEVVVDDLQAACASANCDYAYVTNAAEVTNQSYNDADQTITIDGANLSTDGTIIFGGATCGTLSGGASSLTCTLDHVPFGGDHNVEYYDSNGLVTQSGLSLITVDMAISGVTQAAALNQNGGDELTISGNNFPNNAEYVNIEFDDGTGCTVTSIQPDQITCEVDGFDKSTLDPSA